MTQIKRKTFCGHMTTHFIRKLGELILTTEIHTTIIIIVIVEIAEADKRKKRRKKNIRDDFIHFWLVSISVIVRYLRPKSVVWSHPIKSVRKLYEIVVQFCVCVCVRIFFSSFYLAFRGFVRLIHLWYVIISNKCWNCQSTSKHM